MATLHHLELLVRDGQRFMRQISDQYSLILKAFRETHHASQWVLASGSSSFLITQPKTSTWDTFKKTHPGLYLQDAKFSRGIDTFFDIAVRVKEKEMDRALQTAVRLGGEVLMPKTAVSDVNGTCDIAVIRSCVGNVVHTLVNKENYRGVFLPGFEDLRPPLVENPRIRHIDHITVVSNRGNVDGVLKWYEDVFGFSRFFMNKTEEEDTGFVLDGDIGLRLKAMEYFHCSETMLSTGSKDSDALRLVVAESLPGHDAQTNQVESFLEQHEGPGIQHVGLYTDDIVATAADLRKRGVELQVPPIMYYSHLGKLEEIQSSGESLSLLRENGILLDSEADPNMNDNHTNGCVDKKLLENLYERFLGSFRRYLKQIFTKPVFDKKTFFLELIERQGASGFGTGNIAALWWSVQQSLNLPVNSMNSN